MTRISISPAGEPYWSEPKPKRKAAAREPAGAGLREAVKALARSMDDWLASWPAPSPDDRTAIRAWHTSLRAALASPAEPGLDAMARYILAHGEHSPFCAYTRGGEQCDCGLREAMDAALALSGPKP